MATVIAGVSGAIGSALAQRYLSAHPDQPLIGLCRTPADAPAFLREHPAVTLLDWSADAPVAESLRDDVGEVLGSDGRIHTLIYAAGLLHEAGLFPEKRLEDLNGQHLMRVFQVNCVGFGELVQLLLPRFRGKHLKRIAAISAKVGSISDNGLGGWYGYRCSKAALNMLVKNLSVELPRRLSPMACVALHPGTTESALSEPFQQSLAKLTVHTPAQTADNLFPILERLTDQDNGRFISWDGSDLPW
ncbi:MAG: short-chain dehydrogenase [Marinobacter sp. 34-60-7]|nr:MAG: short-chain dehydrogenase [Marinobacter sp. 34-60-7]